MRARGGGDLPPAQASSVLYEDPASCLLSICAPPETGDAGITEDTGGRGGGGESRRVRACAGRGRPLASRPLLCWFSQDRTDGQLRRAMASHVDGREAAKSNSASGCGASTTPSGFLRGPAAAPGRSEAPLKAWARGPLSPRAGFAPTGFTRAAVMSLMVVPDGSIVMR